MTDDQGELIRAEEAKRLRCRDAAEHWRVTQETLTWLEKQPPVRRNMPEACLREQNRKLAGIGLLRRE